MKYLIRSLAVVLGLGLMMDPQAIAAPRVHAAHFPICFYNNQALAAPAILSGQRTPESFAQVVMLTERVEPVKIQSGTRKIPDEDYAGILNAIRTMGTDPTQLELIVAAAFLSADHFHKTTGLLLRVFALDDASLHESGILALARIGRFLGSTYFKKGSKSVADSIVARIFSIYFPKGRYRVDEESISEKFPNIKLLDFNQQFVVAIRALSEFLLAVPDHIFEHLQHIMPRMFNGENAEWAKEFFPSLLIQKEQRRKRADSATLGSV